jgi:hypothetical protein
MTCLFNARAYRDGSAAAPRRPDTSYWVLDCRAAVGFYVSTSFLVYRARGFRDGPPRVQGVPTAIAPLKDIDIEICSQYIFFFVPAGLGVRAGWARGGRVPGSSQRQRPQNSTSAPGDAIWGAHRCNYIMANLEVFFFAPQVPPPPRCTPVVISTKLTSRLSLAPCCAGQPSFGHIQAAPRWALAPVDSIRRRSNQAKITDLTTARTVGLLKQPSRSDACLPRRGPAHASPDLISSPTKSREVT